MNHVHVLVLVDPVAPGRAIEVGAALFRRGAAVSLVAVAPASMATAAVDTVLRDQAARHPDVAWKVERLVAGGREPTVVDALLAHIGATRPDLVVLDSHGHGPIGEVVLGSTSADLVRSSPAPTLLVGPACDEIGAIDRFVIGVDGSADALGALEVASSLAERLGLHRQLVEVVGEIPVTAGDVEDTAELHRIVRTAAPDITDWDVLHGDDVPVSLARHVAGMPDAVLVVGTHGRSVERPRVLGGTATRVVRRASVPVLVVSPEAAARSCESAGRRKAEEQLR